jgi:hypothetical protein
MCSYVMGYKEREAGMQSITLMATMKCVRFSRARYTAPVFVPTCGCDVLCRFVVFGGSSW